MTQGSQAPSDARFEEGAPGLRLRAQSADDLAIISALLQDAVGLSRDIVWLPRRQRFAMALNRFRWEESGARANERVRSVLGFEHVLSAKARGFDPSKKDQAYELLGLVLEPDEKGGGALRLVCAGEPELRLDIEAVSVVLRDESAPWAVKARPLHKDEG